MKSGGDLECGYGVGKKIQKFKFKFWEGGVICELNQCKARLLCNTLMTGLAV